MFKLKHIKLKLPSSSSSSSGIYKFCELTEKKNAKKTTQKMQKWSLVTAIVLVIYIFSLQNWIGNSTSSSSSSSGISKLWELIEQIGPLIGPLTY